MFPLIDQYWLETRGDRTRIGLSAEFADSIRGDWVAIELPDPGSALRARETFGFITTDRATHDLRAPCGFVVVEVNRRCLESPQLAKLSPRGEGWLLEVEAIEMIAPA